MDLKSNIKSEYNYWLYSFNNLKDQFSLEESVSVSISTILGLKISVSDRK